MELNKKEKKFLINNSPLLKGLFEKRIEDLKDSLFYAEDEKSDEAIRGAGAECRHWISFINKVDKDTDKKKDKKKDNFV